MKDFKILTIKEEEKLSKQELKEYYEKFREYIMNRKLTNTTKGITTIAPHLVKPTQKIAEKLTKLLTSKDVEWICDGIDNVPKEGACIFAYTHQGLLDNFVWMPFIDKHCPILHGAEVNKGLLAAQLNTGLILVKKGDKVNNNNAKLDMIKLLLMGHSITYFPEGTWNLSPNKLHLPMSYGFLDTARKADVPVVPAAHEFTYDTIDGKYTVTRIHTIYGEPIYINENDDIVEKLHEYEEKISTLKYKLIEEKGLFKRSEIDNGDYINYLDKCYKDLKLGKLNLDKERKNIFGATDDFYQFHHINDVPYDNNGNLLDTEENNKIKILNRKHGI